MKRFKALKIVDLNSGRLQLSEAQAQPRRHNLKHVKADVYEIVNPVQFKAGEEFGYDGEINKLLMLDMEEAQQSGRASASSGEQKEPEKLFYSENEALELIEEALTIAEVDELIEGDNRKKILKAAEKKKKALAEELENEAAE